MSQSSWSAWGPGYVIADRYRLQNLLGQGGMGSVWRADHLSLHSPVAIKMIDPSIVGNREALNRFMREAQASAALRSPHVVQIFDYGVHEGVPFIAMELLEGESLADRLERVRKLSPEETSRIITQIARAVGRAHDAGVVHRDLKPDNVFLVRNDEEDIAKVLDFGIAKTTSGTFGTTSQTRTGALLGTPYYMSPEQAEGNKSVDFRSDLWSLAVIAFECLLGARPFESEALGDLVLQICVRPIAVPSTLGDVPPGFDAWFARGTARDPGARFDSARALASELRAIAGIGAREATSPDLSSEAVGARSVDFAAVQKPLARTTGSTTLDTTPGLSRPGSGPNRAIIVGATLATLAVAAVVGSVLATRGGDAPPASSAAHAEPAPQPAPPERVAPTSAAPPVTSQKPAVAPVPVASSAVVAEAPRPVAVPKAATARKTIAKPAPVVKPTPPVRAKPTRAAPKPSAPAGPRPERVDFGI
jgi:serine/threonine-protein kinase